MSLWKLPFQLWCVVWFGPGEGTEDGTTWGGERAEEEKKAGRKYGSYQHSPLQKNRGMMKAKSREEGKEWQEQTDPEWRLKWQKDKLVGVQREWGGEKWTAVMKQETKKRQTDIHLQLSNPCVFTLGTTSLLITLKPRERAGSRRRPGRN